MQAQLLHDLHELLLTTDQAALTLGVTSQYLRRLRMGQGGPVNVRLPGSTVVRYRQADLAAWVAGGAVGAAVPGGRRGRGRPRKALPTMGEGARA